MVSKMPALAKLMEPELEDPLSPTKGKSEGLDGISKDDAPTSTERFPQQKGQGPKHQPGYSWYAKNEK